VTTTRSVWAESVAAALDEALVALALAVGACGADLWETSMWEVPEETFAGFWLGDPANPLLGPDGAPVTDPAARLALAQRFSAPWSVAWHALEVVDYDLTGDLAPWAGPPPPFAGHPHWRDFASVPAWPPSAVLGYVEHCRQRVRDTFADLTDDRAATPLPATHRRAGMPYATLLTGLVAHTSEHAAQLRQFVDSASTGRR
jgi:hypothetical protein